MDQLFNSTLQAHYVEVMGWFGFLRRRQKAPGTEPNADAPDGAVAPAGETTPTVTSPRPTPL